MSTFHIFTHALHMSTCSPVHSCIAHVHLFTYSLMHVAIHLCNIRKCNYSSMHLFAFSFILLCNVCNCTNLLMHLSRVSAYALIHLYSYGPIYLCTCPLMHIFTYAPIRLCTYSLMHLSSYAPICLCIYSIIHLSTDALIH